MTSMYKALLFILNNFDYLNLTINPPNNYGLRFYDSFYRFDNYSVYRLNHCHNTIEANVSIIPPNYDTVRFDNGPANTFIPISTIFAIALEVNDRDINNFLRALRANYMCSILRPNEVKLYGVDVIDRIFNPMRGRIVAADTNLIWVQSDINPHTFYVILLDKILFTRILNS